MIPLHTTGIGLQGINLTKINFGYDVVVGNGIGAGDLEDNDNNKSITVSAHIKPYEGLRIGASYYHDVISKGVENHHGSHSESGGIDEAITQQIFGGSFAFFKKKIELLAEGTYVNNYSDSLQNKNTYGLYAHAGYRIKNKIIPFVRYDKVNYAKNDMWFKTANRQAFIGGIRYEFSYLAVIKAEYQLNDFETGDDNETVTIQFAIGF
ncbi:MAG: hypothetical protein IPP71_06835 [Bacteroidetes bacterium]|nr:hypothetical protein [Bacteroidota bacterium]